MEFSKSITIVLLITVAEITATKGRNVETAATTNKGNFNPLENLVLNRNEGRSAPTKDASLRVKRQLYPDPYYNRRGPLYPVPIIVGGGGFGIGPGFGGRGFGGRGIGGRGIGGRGIGGRGIGGRGIGGRGGIGGGRGGGRG